MLGLWQKASGDFCNTWQEEHSAERIEAGNEGD
jgi:hypothetical protein